MTRPRLRHDSFADYLASDTDLPFEVWLRERDELARARVTTPSGKPSAPGGWAVALLVVIVLACIGVTGVAIAIGALRPASATTGGH